MVDRLAATLNLPHGVLIVLIAGVAALAIGTIIRLTTTSRMPADKRRALRLRLRSWWILFLVLTLATIIGPAAVIALFLVASLLGLREFNTIAAAGAGESARPAIPRWAWLVAPIQYALIYAGWDVAAAAFIPVGALLALTIIATFAPRSAASVPGAIGATPSAAGATPRGFLRAVGAASWGAMLLLYFISHAPMLLTVPPGNLDLAAGLGLLVYLMILTETNDIAQAICGRRFGKRKIVPRISPGKTTEGLLGGMATTLLLAIAIAPLLTPWAPGSSDPGAANNSLPWWLWPAIIGLVLSPAGFLGDIAMSALKREAGVKDSGDLLPGQGGMLDRIDSLIFTAPIFYYLLLAALPAATAIESAP